jgi:NADPH:quinone reductase-like Zn-dependent oxidoreductase/acyl carrier protein
VQLHVRRPGALDGLHLRPLHTPAPGPGEVQVRVAAAGLNFRDLLNVLDLYPGEAGPLGGELAGDVVAVGDGVETFAVGDRVFGFAAGAFASTVNCTAALLTPRPTGLSVTQAAAVPIAFGTAQWAFELAQLQAGERVLIHAAAGGVGLAAVQLAQTRGAEVFATASAAKRDYLRGLGVAHVFDSRSTGFAEAIRRASGGAGVDVVLNSLTGEGFIEATLSVLAVGGRFVEIGKRGIWPATQMQQQRPDVAYHVLALDEELRRQPSRVGAVLAALASRLGRGELQPLRQRVYPLAEAEAALRCMQQARHIGKIVLRLPAALTLVQEGTYLVSGGLGALGLQAARWLAEGGAGVVLLVGRRRPSASAQEVLEGLRARGCRVEVQLADVGEAAAVGRLLGYIARELPPLRGVVHAAGVLDDGVLGGQDVGRLGRVLGGKAAGAWLLHEATRGRPLDFFVLYSSASSVLGPAGQGTYAAANAFLDGLAQHRHALGLPATCVNWGPWTDAGMAAGATIRAQLARQGLTPLKPGQAHRALAQLLETGTSGMVLDADWKRMSKHLGDAHPPILSGLLVRSGPNGDGLLSRRLLATPAAARGQVLTEHLQRELQQILSLAEPPAADSGFFDLGMDSLMAVELRNRLQAQLGQAYPVSNTLAFDYPTVRRLAQHLGEKLGVLGEETERDRAVDRNRADREIDDDIRRLTQATHSEIVQELHQLLAVEDNDVVGRP